MILLDIPNSHFRIPSTAPSIKLSKVPSCELLSRQCTEAFEAFQTSAAQERLC